MLYYTGSVWQTGTERNSRLYLQSSAFEFFLRAMTLAAPQNYDFLPLLAVSYKTIEENKCNCQLPIIDIFAASSLAILFFAIIILMGSGKGRALSNYHEENR